MHFLSLAALLGVVAVAHGLITFNAYDDAEKDARDIFNILMRPRTPERYLPKSYFLKHGIKPSTRLSAFSFKNCGNPATEAGKLVSLQVTPDPIKLPGEVGVAFVFDVARAAQSPLKMTWSSDCWDVSNDCIPVSGTKTETIGSDVITGWFLTGGDAGIAQTSVLIKKRVTSHWLTVPCIAEFGSCDYDDFCGILEMIQGCPQPFIDHHVPCQCPFKQGNYTLPMTQFDVDAAYLPPGDYFAQLNMTLHNAPVTCYQLYFTFASS